MAVLTVREIVNEIRASVPESLQESWDNSGVQVAFGHAPVSKVLTCLEISEGTVAEAVAAGAEMIVSHHPLIFGGIKHIDDSEPIGRIIQQLIANGISVYSSHTPFDLVDGGNNDVLAEKLGLSEVVTESEDGFCKSGVLPEKMSLREFVLYVADHLELDVKQVRAAGDPDSTISVVGLCTGAGSEYAKAAQAAGCDVMVTGDVKHHEALDVIADGFCIVDAGHYGTEKFFAHSMGKRLKGIFGEKIEIVETNTVTDPFIVL